MCGRFVLAYSTDDLRAEFAVGHVVEPDLGPSWNVAPSQPVRIVAERYLDTADNDDGPRIAERMLTTARWGLVPHWAKDRSIGMKMINARSETVTSKPAFRAAATRRRCLVPANGYYEWMADTSVGKGPKTPYYLHEPDGAPLAMAGLYEIWRDRELPDDAAEAMLWTCTVITRTAPDSLGHIHERSPVLVPRDMRDDWLDCSADGAPGAAELLAAMPPPALLPREVGRLVGNVRNNSPDLIRPIQPAEPDTLF